SPPRHLCDNLADAPLSWWKKDGKSTNKRHASELEAAKHYDSMMRQIHGDKWQFLNFKTQ
ncbi:hypothetical protein, partial [Zavarzinella formosa]|uniref:hypothetical protein n=1 Tax=Zavarzinella formosa TaxID=360055 RepID=UPI000594F3C4